MVTVRELIRMLVEDANLDDWVYVEQGSPQNLDHVRTMSIEKGSVVLVSNID